ncbi:MAG: hypothetical protein WCR19_02175 [Acholeplasmataceae bacterium]
MKKMSERKIIKKINALRINHHFIPEYAENYTLIYTGNRQDFNNYDFSLRDEKGNQLILRKTVLGDQSVEILMMLDTPEGKFINTQRLFNNNDMPVYTYCMESKKIWKFVFKGDVINTNSNDKKISYLEVSAIFNSNEPMIDTFEQIDEKLSISKILSSHFDQEVLNQKDLYEQVSYIQHGNVKAEILIDNQKIELNSKAIRKHEFGKLSYKNLFTLINI